MNVLIDPYHIFVILLSFLTHLPKDNGKMLEYLFIMV